MFFRYVLQFTGWYCTSHLKGVWYISWAKNGQRRKVGGDTWFACMLHVGSTAGMFQSSSELSAQGHRDEKVLCDLNCHGFRRFTHLLLTPGPCSLFPDEFSQPHWKSCLICTSCMAKYINFKETADLEHRGDYPRGVGLKPERKPTFEKVEEPTTEHTGTATYYSGHGLTSLTAAWKDEPRK